MLWCHADGCESLADGGGDLCVFHEMLDGSPSACDTTAIAGDATDSWRVAKYEAQAPVLTEHFFRPWSKRNGRDLSAHECLSNVDAQEFFEMRRWPGGCRCPHCLGSAVSRLVRSNGKTLWRCGPCRRQFTVRIGTIMQGSPIQLLSWLSVLQFSSSTARAMRAQDIVRLISVTQKSAWFMAHRVRECIRGAVEASTVTGLGIRGIQSKHRHRYAAEVSFLITIPRQGDRLDALLRGAFRSRLLHSDLIE